MDEFNITDPLASFKIEIVEALRLVIDPELHVNIIDLGLVYEVEVASEGKKILVVMTLSSRHCPMGESILSAVKNCLSDRFEGYEVEVDLVWEPAWTYDNITEEGRRLLSI